MKFTEFTERRAAMCKAFEMDCTKCPYHPHLKCKLVSACYKFCMNNPAVAISLLQIWEKENPYLKECPFCGNEAKLFFGMGEMWGVTCKSEHCGAIPAWHKTKEAAAEAWNRRAATE